MRWVGSLIIDDDTTWVALAKASVAHSLNSGFRRKSRRHWTTAEALLLERNLHVTGSLFLRDLVCGLSKARSWAL